MRTFVIFASIAFFVGCAERAGHFHRADTATSQRAADVQYCRDTATIKAGEVGGGLAGYVEHKERYNAAFRVCMADRGYKRR